MKLKKYLDVFVKDNTGNFYSNPLKLSEVYLITRILKENQSIKVSILECTESEYKSIFG